MYILKNPTHIDCCDFVLAYINLLLKGTQQQQRQQRPKTPFQVVLVDIKKAAKDRMIRCVKKPLEEKDLKYVALTYRWGELHETLIDTKVGYTASITSFALDDFYGLCEMMTMESDLKHIKYVWVDAICVDQRPSKRKAIIYQMSNIYDKATYILAVPDLHLNYLKRISIKNYDIIDDGIKYCKDIYYLIHGNTDPFTVLEEKFLNDSNVPNDPPSLRQLLLKHTDHFGDSFMQYKMHAHPYCPVLTLNRISQTVNPLSSLPCWWKKKNGLISNLHQCNTAFCPITFFERDHPRSQLVDKLDFEEASWKPKIIERSTCIRQSMEFLTDLVEDWSSRVWVISEYNIAKKKNNLKYWFIQLTLGHSNSPFYSVMDDEFRFFKFDFEDASFADAMLKTTYYVNRKESRETKMFSTNPIYIRFHYTMIRHLKQQTFLEMILGSKASKNEDRFYSVLPLSEYANKLTEVSDWDIYNMVLIKLKLYDIMTVKDKLTLLFWSAHEDTIGNDILPTFATSTLSLAFQPGRLIRLLSNYAYNIPLCKRLGIHHASIQTLDVVSIPAFPHNLEVPSDNDCHDYKITLIGSFAENKWVIPCHHHFDQPRYYNGNRGLEGPPFFDIY
ncbi:hypothetical protein BCR42DRAFT_497159 [Absidia repens]|uniref:Heterokaryon incompatibility domain-containing protein n=1 Tax=Absidia repens TaxID=90262 RepID=A0A1X2HSN1_9FUNG|nr:hypothetical protein BCR42DRAFT_497159 [Absidia repens]